jgi:hypothetical protein
MNDKMVQYLKLPVVSESLREHIYNLTKSKRSVVAIVFNHILQNLELEWLEDHDKFMEIETIRMMSVRFRSCLLVSNLFIQTAENGTVKAVKTAKLVKLLELLLLLTCRLLVYN